MLAGPAWAADPATLPDREWQRQQERERALREQQQIVPESRPSTPEITDPGRLPTDESPCFTIEHIEFKGDEEGLFHWALAAADRKDDPATGRCLGVEGINRVIKRVQNAIIAQGFITTRVRIEPQDLSRGTLSLTLIPGRIRDIRFTADSGKRANHRNALPGGSGDLLNLRDIEQGLENFKRVPTADAGIQIEPAEAPDARPGESDLLIAWQQTFPLRLTLSLDDSGSEETGKYQTGITLSFDHPLGLNDLFYFNINQDADGDADQHGTRGKSLHYSLPFGYWRLSYTGSRYEYHQSVAGLNQTYRYSGKTHNSELELSRMIRRDGSSKTALRVAGWLRGSRNYVDDTEVEIQRRRMAGWALGLRHTHYLGAATLHVDLAYRRGTGAFDALHAPEENFDEGTSRPRFLTARLDYSLPFKVHGQQFSYSAEYRGQWNDTPLVPQDRFAIGGRYTVRGFDGERQLSADRGWLLRNEIGVLIFAGHQLYAGLDYGRVDGQSSDLLIGKRLAGGVFGLRGSYQKLHYDLFVGAPIQKPDGFITDPTVTGFSLYCML